MSESKEEDLVGCLNCLVNGIKHKRPAFCKSKYRRKEDVPWNLCADSFHAIRRLIEQSKGDDFPKIICLCGSTRFTEQMLVKQWELTKQGFVVFSWCALPDWYFQGDDKNHIGDQEGVKEMIDKVHLRKIDLADEVLILNIDGYIGESTRNELNYAQKIGKKVRFLEPDKAGIEIEKEK